MAPAPSPVEPESPPRIDDLPASPLLVPEPAPPDRADKADKAARKSFLIDGLNICCWGKKPSLAPLLSLAAELKRKGALFICFFDANTRFILAEHGERETYEKLIEKYDCFGEVPGGTQADDFLLFRAHKTGEAIITNDQYRDAKYREKYKWLRSVSPRLCKGVVLGGYLSIPELDVHARVNETLEGAIREYDGASGALPAAASPAAPASPVSPVSPVSGERTGARRRRRRGRKRPSDAKSSESKSE
jgi:hypothetical protein